MSARLLARASLGQGAATVWSALLGVFTAPILIHNLGSALYGVFALIGVVSSYLSNLQFGFGHAVLRFLAHARARGDRDGEQAAIGNALVIFLAAASLTFALAFLGASFIVQHFAHGPGRLHGLFISSVRLGAVIVTVSLLSSLWSAALQAVGRFGFLIQSSWLVGTMLSVSSVAIVLTGGGLLNVLRAQLLILVIQSLAQLHALSRSTTARLVPKLHLVTLREMSVFAAHTFAAGVGSQILAQGPSAILAGYGTTAELAIFALPRTIMQQLDGLVSSASLGFLPFASAASSNPDRTQITRLYHSNLRLTVLLLAPFSCFIAAFAHPLLMVWIGGSFAHKATAPLQFFAGSTLVWGLASAPADVARGFGRPGLVTAFTATGSAVTVALCLLLVPTYRASGAACALFIAGTAVTIPFVFFISLQVLGVSKAAMFSSLARPLAALCAAGGISAAGRLVSDTLVCTAVTGVVLTVVYLSFVIRVVLDRREREVLRSLLRAPSPNAQLAVLRVQKAEGEPSKPFPTNR